MGPWVPMEFLSASQGRILRILTSTSPTLSPPTDNATVPQFPGVEVETHPEPLPEVSQGRRQGQSMPEPGAERACSPHSEYSL